jgi:hypothetical protein
MPPDAHGVRAYSHVNTFSSAAMAFDVLRDAVYLDILKNGYDYLQQTQVYATGGYGPNERFMAPDGSLGRALDTRSDTAPPDKRAVRLKFRPFYDTGEGYPYFMYFDRRGLPYKLW